MKRATLLLCLLTTYCVYGQSDQAFDAFAESRYSEAKQLFEQASQLASKPEHQTFFTIKAALCDARLGLLDEAKARLDAIAGQKSLSGQNKAAIANANGEISLQMGLYEGAVTAFELENHLLGKEASEVLAHNLTNLGLAHWQLGDMELAKGYLGQALDMRTSLGDHIAMARSHNNLGLVLSEGSPQEAEQEYLQALKAYRTTLGESHPSYILTLNNLAILQGKLGDYQGALETY